MSESPLEPGIRAPDFALPCPSGNPVRFYGHAGGMPCILIFAEQTHSLIVEKFVRDLTSTSYVRVKIFGVIPYESNSSNSAQFSFETFTEPQSAVSSPYGVAGNKPSLFVLDENLRIVSWHQLDEPKMVAQAVTQQLAKTACDDGCQHIEQPAPVLIIPRVLDENWCAELISTWHRDGAEPTGIESSIGGQRINIIEENAKRRKDCVVSEPKLLKKLSSSLGRRIIPEVQKVFAYRATQFEGFKIVRYEFSEGGFFHAHRDNLSPTTVHRKFGLTVNLNANFEGGQLRFPEYGNSLYSPNSGEALLFSCSLLHEVLPVTQGQRFSLLSFLFDSSK